MSFRWRRPGRAAGILHGALPRASKPDRTSALAIQQMNCSSIAISTQDAGKLDLLITNLSIGQEGCRQLPLFTDSLRLAVASRSSLARARRVSLEALDGHPLIVRTHCEHLQHASRILDRDKVKPMVVHRTRYDDRALALVAGGLGACFIPDSFSVPAVKMLGVSQVDLRRTVGIEWPSDSIEPLVAAVLERFAAARTRGTGRA